MEIEARELQIGNTTEFRLNKNTRVVGEISNITEISRVGRNVLLEISLTGLDGRTGYKIKVLKIVPKQKKEKTVKVRPYTQKQFEKFCMNVRKDLQNDHADYFDDACIDTARGILLTEPRIKAYFEHAKMPKSFWEGALADYIHG